MTAIVSPNQWEMIVVAVREQPFTGHQQGPEMLRGMEQRPHLFADLGLVSSPINNVQNSNKCLSHRLCGRLRHGADVLESRFCRSVESGEAFPKHFDEIITGSHLGLLDETK